MFCTKCGENNENGNPFCKRCGAPLTTARNYNMNQSPSPYTPPVSVRPIKYKRQGLIIGILIAVVAIIAIAASIYFFHGKLSKSGAVLWPGFGSSARKGFVVTFHPAGGYNASKSEIDAAASVLNKRLIGIGAKGSNITCDYNSESIIVRFTPPAGVTDENTLVSKLGFIDKFTLKDAEGVVALEGKDIEKAMAHTGSQGHYIVELTMTSDGKIKFADVTRKYLNQSISILIDDQIISNPLITSVINDGVCEIDGNFTLQQAKDLANDINSGALPFAMEADSVQAEGQK